MSNKEIDYLAEAISGPQKVCALLISRLDPEDAYDINYILQRAAGLSDDLGTKQTLNEIVTQAKGIMAQLTRYQE